MLYALNWFIVISLVALWSLTAWALHGVAVWTVSNAGALTGVASGVGAVRPQDWLAPWVPPEIAQLVTGLLSSLAPLIDSLLQTVPALAGGVSVIAWGLWGIGSVLLLLLGVGVHVLVALWRRRGGGSVSDDVRRAFAAR